MVWFLDAGHVQHYYYRRCKGQDMEVVTRFQVKETRQQECIMTREVSAAVLVCNGSRSCSFDMQGNITL
jgi:hypothetical protein